MFVFRRIKLIPYRKAEYNQLNFPLPRTDLFQNVTNGVITMGAKDWMIRLVLNHVNEVLSIQDVTSLIVALPEMTFGELQSLTRSIASSSHAEYQSERAHHRVFLQNY
jgi:hypothetical protein